MQDDGRFPSGRAAPQLGAPGGGGGAKCDRQGGEAVAACHRGRAVDEPAQHEASPQGKRPARNSPGSEWGAPHSRKIERVLRSLYLPLSVAKTTASMHAFMYEAQGKTKGLPSCVYGRRTLQQAKSNGLECKKRRTFNPSKHDRQRSLFRCPAGRSCIIVDTLDPFSHHRP